MLLRYSPGSPFGRKPAIAVHLLGLVGKIDMVNHEADPDNSIRQRNPLHKVPMLVTDSGAEIFDSPVIVEYLDELAGGGKLLPASGEERYKALTRLALADGIAEASVLINYEDRWREPEQKSQKWIEHQRGKVERGFAFFEANVPASFDAAAIGLFCAVTYVDQRNDIPGWRDRLPRLAAWFEKVRTSEPSIAATDP